MKEDLKKFVHSRTTFGLIVINFLLFVLTSAGGNRLYEQGVLYAPAVLEGGQWWRPVTAMFLHANLQHICSNMLVLYAAGVIVERNYGHLKMLLIYMVSGIAGNLFSMWYEITFSVSRTSLGASGAVYGVLAAMVVLIIAGRRQIRRGSTIWVRVLLMLVYCAYSGVASQGVNNEAHIGGFAAGAVLALFMLPAAARIDLHDVYL